VLGEKDDAVRISLTEQLDYDKYKTEDILSWKEIHQTGDITGRFERLLPDSNLLQTLFLRNKAKEFYKLNNREIWVVEKTDGNYYMLNIFDKDTANVQEVSPEVALAADMLIQPSKYFSQKDYIVNGVVNFNSLFKSIISRKELQSATSSTPDLLNFNNDLGMALIGPDPVNLKSENPLEIFLIGAKTDTINYMSIFSRMTYLVDTMGQ